LLTYHFPRGNEEISWSSADNEINLSLFPLSRQHDASTPYWNNRLIDVVSVQPVSNDALCWSWIDYGRFIFDFGSLSRTALLLLRWLWCSRILLCLFVDRGSHCTQQSNKAASRSTNPRWVGKEPNGTRFHNSGVGGWVQQPSSADKDNPSGWTGEYERTTAPRRAIALCLILHRAYHVITVSVCLCVCVCVHYSCSCIDETIYLTCSLLCFQFYNLSSDGTFAWLINLLIDWSIESSTV